MATQRTRAALLVLFADNVTGQISAQDLRDFLVTMMEPEFANPGDFWKQPSPKNTHTDLTARGWIDYSQTIGSASTTFGQIMHMDSCGWWTVATVDSHSNGILGVVLGSYASHTTTARILRRGIVYNSLWSIGALSNYGQILVLGSNNQSGSFSIVGGFTSHWIIGLMEHSDLASVYRTDKIRFDPDWCVRELP